MGKTTHISENISKTQIVEMIFESIRKSSENQSSAISEETLKKFTKDAEKIGSTKESEKSHRSKDQNKEAQKKGSSEEGDDENLEEKPKNKDRYGRFKTKGKNLDIKG